MDNFNIVKKFLFPIPKPPHYEYDSFEGELIFLPPLKTDENIFLPIPALLALPMQERMQNNDQPGRIHPAPAASSSSSSSASSSSSSLLSSFRHTSIAAPIAITAHPTAHTAANVKSTAALEGEAEAQAEAAASLSAPSSPSLSPSPPPAPSGSTVHNAALAAALFSKIPRCNQDVPAIFLPYPQSDLLVVFSHGNGCDLGSMHNVMSYYRLQWRAHILMYEYPQYGVSEGDADEEQINAAAFRVAHFVHHQLHFPFSRVVFYGQSLGSGPTLRVCSFLNQNNCHVGGIILHSPYLSIRKAAQFLVGNVLALTVGERFENEQEIVHVIDPLLVIHGMKDSIIPSWHSEKLFDLCPSDRKHLLLVDTATHNEFDHFQDVIFPVARFFDQYLRRYNKSAMWGPIGTGIGAAMEDNKSDTASASEERKESGGDASSVERVPPEIKLDKKLFSVPTSIVNASLARREAAKIAAATAAAGQGGPDANSQQQPAAPPIHEVVHGAAAAMLSSISNSLQWASASTAALFAPLTNDLVDAPAPLSPAPVHQFMATWDTNDNGNGNGSVSFDKKASAVSSWTSTAGSIPSSALELSVENLNDDDAAVQNAIFNNLGDIPLDSYDADAAEVDDIIRSLAAMQATKNHSNDSASETLAAALPPASAPASSSTPSVEASSVHRSSPGMVRALHDGSPLARRFDGDDEQHTDDEFDLSREHTHSHSRTGSHGHGLEDDEVDGLINDHAIQTERHSQAAAESVTDESSD